MLNLATKFSPERTAFRTAAEAGFRCAEFWLDVDYLADWQAIAELAGQFPL